MQSPNVFEIKVPPPDMIDLQVQRPHGSDLKAESPERAPGAQAPAAHHTSPPLTPRMEGKKHHAPDQGQSHHHPHMKRQCCGIHQIGQPHTAPYTHISHVKVLRHTKLQVVILPFGQPRPLGRGTSLPELTVWSLVLLPRLRPDPEGPASV